MSTPKVRVAEAVTVLAASPDKPLMFHGDTNSRTGHRAPNGAVLDRLSSDTVVNSRGRWLLRLCSDTSMTILNGTVKESDGRGAFTSFQPLGSSVIDYCFVSAGLVPRIADGTLRIVKSPVWSDHAQIHTVVIGPEEEAETPVVMRPARVPIVFGEPTALDRLLDATLAAASHPTAVYIATSSRKKSAAFAVWWGEGSKANKSFRIEGEASDGLACILAILCAVRDCSSDKSLVIYTSSQYAIRSFCYWAGDNETRGWTCANGDALRDSVAWIAQRHAPGRRRTQKHAHREAVPFFHYGSAPSISTAPGETALKGVRKVSTQLEEISEPKAHGTVPDIDVEDIIDPDIAHRGRKRERVLMRKKPDEAGGMQRPRVTPLQLHDSFKARLNPPELLPECFDADLHDIVRSLNATIPRVTIDRTAGKFFTRRITIKDIQEVKRKLQKKSFRSAVGIDEVSYSQIMTIPNEALVTLFHACIDDLDAPQKWLVTLLVGILKEGRAVDDPESYRLVGLECCLLKVLTLLLDGRLREWAAANNIIPESQNGFQAGHRTDDNSFILLCAIHRARAEGKTLYVFFGDMTNAFPYTDVGRLWSDMYAAGVGGPFFDLIRTLYARMRYAVKFGDENCLPFRSLIGLFTGDSASPSLWNIYFADFRLPPHKDDVHLNGRPVSQAEQADDNLIMSTSFPAFQTKVHNFHKWGANKRAFVSAKKSKWMIFGPLPAEIPTLWCGDTAVELVFEFKYVGVWFTSTHRNVFARHYAIKASKARVTSNAIFALKHRIGSLPVREGLVLYRARVDCYLISGGELALDTDAALLQDLQDVQHAFLRRLLGLNPFSMLAVLFTETGQIPVRIRRLLLALGRLKYLLGVDRRRVVYDAFLDSVALCREGKPSWASDLLIMLRRLPTAIVLTPDDLLSVERVEALRKEILDIVDTGLQRDIDGLVKTHLLRNRLEVGEDNCLHVVPRRLRHYLTLVVVPAHRKALTGLLLSDHNLSVERLRYGARYRLPVPRHWRLCRLCRGAVEDEAHALFGCVADSRLVDFRKEFLAKLAGDDPDLRKAHSTIPDYEFLLAVVQSRKAVVVFARFVFLVLQIFQETPAFIPLAYKVTV
ncbi:Reverse transcriptase domain-containing protein [Mycena sanguinolenta]|uniref:Reverse transcriptase domain-containing protein n=1 Tax=Mycena sanguinolenta TaxID=230812 RepID=A0A8H6YF69_9AGAR|nr:Reverse transcriptase domain-containing protein [Mycena sanguinolenta]